MNSKKKLFEAEDFDKKKKLFTSSDFDKESEETISIGCPENGNNEDKGVCNRNEKSNLKNWILVIRCFVAKNWKWISFIALCVICVIGYFIFSRSGDTSATESEQETVLVEETILPADSVGNQEESAEEVLPTHENEVSKNADDKNTKVNEAPASTDKSSNIATATTSVVSSANVSNDVETEAMKVIRGDYGVGQERKDILGTKYQTIQSRVNELKREGIF